MEILYILSLHSLNCFKHSVTCERSQMSRGFFYPGPTRGKPWQEVIAGLTQSFNTWSGGKREHWQSAQARSLLQTRKTSSWFQMSTGPRDLHPVRLTGTSYSEPAWPCGVKRMPGKLLTHIICLNFSSSHTSS